MWKSNLRARAFFSEEEEHRACPMFSAYSALFSKVLVHISAATIWDFLIQNSVFLFRHVTKSVSHSLALKACGSHSEWNEWDLSSLWSLFSDDAICVRGHWWACMSTSTRHWTWNESNYAVRPHTHMPRETISMKVMFKCY